MPLKSSDDSRMTSRSDLQKQFGSIDIYLFDQLLKGRITSEMRVLDAGCGGGRNLIYFFCSGFDTSGVDQSPEAIAQIRSLAAQLAPHLPVDNFRVAAIEQMPFDDESFDVVIALCQRRGALAQHGPGDVASAEAGRDLLCPAGLDYWHGR